MEHAEIRTETNPETGEQAYPWMDAQGNALNANGSVVECDCERCLAKDCKCEWVGSGDGRRRVSACTPCLLDAANKF